MDGLHLILLYDYYGELLTSRQRECFDLHYNQDLSLGEIAQELGVSRQGVYDNIARAESLLQNMEEKTGCLQRDMAYRDVMKRITQIALPLCSSSDSEVRKAAEKIMNAVKSTEE